MQGCHLIPIENCPDYRSRRFPGLQSLSRVDARAVEQALIELYGLAKNGGALLNKINSIAQSNPIYQQSMQRAAEILRQVGFPGF